MARLSRALGPNEVVVELAGKRQQRFAFDALGPPLRGNGSDKVGTTSLPGMMLAFNFEKKTVRTIEPLLYADGVPKDVFAKYIEQFIQSERVFDALSQSQFAILVREVKAHISDGNVRVVQGKFPK